MTMHTVRYGGVLVRAESAAWLSDVPGALQKYSAHTARSRTR